MNSSEEKFHTVAETSIHQLLDSLERLGDDLELEGFDLEYSVSSLTSCTHASLVGIHYGFLW